MAAVRPVLPTDLAALVGSGRVYPNEAVTLDRGAPDPSPLPLETAFEQWLSFATGKHTWISVRGATLRGLASARRRATKAAWELDCLIDATEDDPSILMSLFDRVAHDAGEAGAEKIFLRVACDSDVIPTARRCGFVPYATEVAMQSEGIAHTKPNSASTIGLRRWIREDAYATFQLYNRCTPEVIRRVEAPTFSQWQAARERIGSRARQWVTGEEGHLTGWLRAAGTGDVGRFELMSDLTEPRLVETLIDSALSRLSEQPVLWTRVPEFAEGVRLHLAQRGFVSTGEFTLLAKPIARRAETPQLASVVLA